MILLAVLSADGVNQDVIDNGGGQHDENRDAPSCKSRPDCTQANQRTPRRMYDSEFLQVIPAGVSEAEQLHILLSGPEPDPDGKSQTEETHNKGKCIELIHCLWFIGLKIAIISQQPNTAQSLSLPLIRNDSSMIEQNPQLKRLIRTLPNRKCLFHFSPQ